MKSILFALVAISIVSSNSAYGHKLLSHDDSHRDIDSALQIPDHKISWAIYENLGKNEAKFYKFDAKQGESFFASIVVPKLEGLEEYSPTIILMEPRTNGMSSAQQKFLYEGDYPGFEFYEPFGQVTYWERQDVSLKLPVDGEYFIIVADEKNQGGKYSLAIGTIEDFSGSDFFTILPKAWLDTKLFVNDYSSLGIFFGMALGIPILIIFSIFQKRRINDSPKSLNASDVQNWT